MGGTIQRLDYSILSQCCSPEETDAIQRRFGVFYWRGRIYRLRGERIVEVTFHRNYDGAVLSREIELSNFRVSFEMEYDDGPDSPTPGRRMMDCILHIDCGPDIFFTIVGEDVYSGRALLRALRKAGGAQLAFRARDIDRIQRVSAHFQHLDTLNCRRTADGKDGHRC